MKAQERESLLKTLKTRFEKNMHRHADAKWADVEARLLASPAKLQSLQEMESTGGEPDVIGSAAKSGEVLLCDCAAESPQGRRSLCYDAEALNARKENKPSGSAMEVAATMGVTLLTEEQYRKLQTLGEFDLKTSSWIATPPAMRKLGGALFCDRRYGQVFTYHNGVQSYYAARGFRASLTV